MQSARARGVSETFAFPTGAILVCTSCGRPLFRFERGVSLGEKASRVLDALRPVRSMDLDSLKDRPDVDAGVRALIADVDAQGARAVYLDTITQPRMGDPALCPFCQHAYVQVRTAETSDTIDRGYVWEPVVIPPRSAEPIRGGCHA